MPDDRQMEKLRGWINGLLALGLIACGVAGLLWFAATKPHAERRSAAHHLPSVEVRRLQATVCNAPIVGYGTVRPKRQVKIIPEVTGRLIEVHRDLAPGNLISKGELLFEIDSRLYEAQVRQAEADVARLEVQMKRHQDRRASLEARLALAERQAELARTNLERDQKLFSQNSLSAPELEASEDRFLRTRDAVLSYESELTLIPHQIAETEALLTTARSQREEAKLRLEATKIYCPFDAQVDSVTAQESQVVISNFQIAALTDMEALEVPVVLDPRELRWTDEAAFASALGQDLESAPDARVTWNLQGQEFSWSGKVTRLERMDKTTRTAHLIVEIRDIMLSLDLDAGEKRPPLSVGMFCRTEIPTEPLPGALVVPRHAVREDGQVYVFQPDPGNGDRGRLVLKQVEILRSLGEEVLVDYAREGVEPVDEPATGLAEGDLIILSPLPKAVQGMPLTLRSPAEAFAEGRRAPARPRGTTVLVAGHGPATPPDDRAWGVR